MRPLLFVSCLMLALTGGCSVLSPHPRAVAAVAPQPEPTADAAEWREIARPADQQRLDAIAVRWEDATTGLPRRLQPRTAADRQLLDPEAARPLPALTPGGYQCTRIRLGGRTKFTRFKPDTCYVKLDGGHLSYTTQTGTLMPGGWLYPDGDARMILLATDRPARTKSAPAYGVDASRDLVGMVERLGPMRWRLTIPRADELDVWELSPWPKQGLDD